MFALPSVGPIFASYNRFSSRRADATDLEALVLLHQDTEIVESRFCAIVRAALSDPQVGLIGCVGAIDVRSIAWWEGSVAQASFLHRFPEHGGGDLPAFSWAWHEAPPYARIGEVDTVDGFLMVLSPWVVRNLRFDESLGQLHGYDFDFCLQVREAGYKVVTSRLQGRPQPFADAVRRPRVMGPGAYRRRREVGRTDRRASGSTAEPGWSERAAPRRCAMRRCWSITPTS